MLNLQICTVIIMTKKTLKKKNKIIKKKKFMRFMRFLRFKPVIHGFKIQQDIHYDMEASAIVQ